MHFELFGRLKKNAAKGGAPTPSNSYSQQTPEPMGSPSEMIESLKAQGYPEAEIIRALQSEGYSAPEIDDALNMALRNEVMGNDPTSPHDFEPSMDFGSSGFQDMGTQYPEDDLDAEDDFDDVLPSPQHIESTGSGFEKTEQIEEMIEGIINERISRISGNIDELSSDIESTKKTIDDAQASMQTADVNLGNEIAAVCTKSNENFATLQALESRVSALEKAFKDVIPNLVDSIREMREMLNETSAPQIDTDSLEIPKRKVFD